MGKKIVNIILFLAVLAAAVGMTIYVGQGATGVMIYNFVFLGIMVILYLAGMIGGMFRMDNIAEALANATEELSGIFKTSGKVATEKLVHLNDIFNHTYLDGKMVNFTDSVARSEEGIGEIEDYLNEEELDNHIHKRLLEMIPDIFTSLGILGTFVGLVWGLKNFAPNDYEAMTSSVAALVDGIKVAFLTSIYGISLSIIYTFGMKSEYSSMTENLQAFLEKFHSCVMPTAENESRNLLVSSQKNQTAAMEQMAEQFSVQMADSFEKVITPTFVKMNESLDMLATSVLRCQKDAVKDILDVFLKEMHSSFNLQFKDFNEALAQLKKAQNDNAAYTSELYQTMTRQLTESYVKQERMMKELMEQLTHTQGKYMDTASRILQENREIQKMQQADYQHIADYLKDAERSSAKFWVACNQTMQKYVEAASGSVERISSANQAGEEVLRSNKRMIEEFDSRMREFMEYQKKSYQTMDQVRALLAEITVAKNNKEIYLTSGSFNNQNSNRETLKQMQNMFEEQSERQQAALDEMSRNIKDLSKNAQRGKFSIFK
ncbi:MAG: MotA/TolQ/ExbB proton channel family protein [Eubacteriales bacterium]|nr:MotA/TolQ/ExbB proton channel family protein [Eubacteriales bacterium]